MFHRTQKKQKKKKGFTLVEIMIVVTIIGILATIFIVAWGLSAQDKAALSNYKRQMQSVRAGIMLCKSAGASVGTGGAPNTPICSSLGANSPVYATIDKACNDNTTYFFTIGGPLESSRNWTVTTTTSGGSAWNCVACNITCRISGCTFSGTC